MENCWNKFGQFVQIFRWQMMDGMEQCHEGEGNGDDCGWLTVLEAAANDTAMFRKNSGKLWKISLFLGSQMNVNQAEKYILNCQKSLIIVKSLSMNSIRCKFTNSESFISSILVWLHLIWSSILSSIRKKWKEKLENWRS